MGFGRRRREKKPFPKFLKEDKGHYSERKMLSPTQHLTLKYIYKLIN